MDVHISIIADFKRIFPDIEIIDWCLSGHAWVFNRQQDVPKHINAQTWIQLDSKMIEKFRRKYDSFLRSFDFFIVGYASCFAMIYEPYNKPIVMLNAVRYDVPFCWTRNTSMIDSFNKCLQRLHSNRRLIVVSNNKADQKYLEYATYIPSPRIPSLCEYTGQRYSPTKTTFLCYHGVVPNHSLITQKKDLPDRHSWGDLIQYKGIISIPYEISLMSLFEQFTMGMPFFFPSQQFWKKIQDIQSIRKYWDVLPQYYRDLGDVNTWIDLSDIYDTFQSPNTYYFDSYDHLVELLQSFVYVDDSEFRQKRATEIKDRLKTHLRTHGLQV